MAWMGESPGGSLLVSRHEQDAGEWKERGWKVTPLCSGIEIAKLIEYFRKDGYQEYGWHGDEKGFSPAETAIYFLRERATLGKSAPPLAESVGDAEALEDLQALADQWISDSEEAASYPAPQPRGAIECAEDLHEWIREHQRKHVGREGVKP